MLPRSRVDPILELTAEQRQRVLEEADRTFHRDHDPWPVNTLHLTTLALAAVAMVAFYFWTGRFELAIALPVLAFELALSRHRAFRGPRFAKAWMLAIYILVTTLLLLIVAAFVGWQGIVVNMLAMAIELVVMLVVSRRWMRPYVWRALRDLGIDDLCTACGYRLRGLPRTIVRCPECGEVRTFPRATSQPETVPTRMIEGSGAIDAL